VLAVRLSLVSPCRDGSPGTHRPVPV